MKSAMPRLFRKSTFIESALIAAFATHALGLLTMAAFLLPLMPTADATHDLFRMQGITAHAWRWRLGWLPWNFSALADLFLSYALVRTAAVPRAAAWTALLLTVTAIIPDQIAEILWVTRGVEIARAADLQAYRAFEAWIFPLTAGWAAGLYTLAAIAWSVGLAGARLWSHGLTIFSCGLWALFVFASAALLLPEAIRPAQSIVAGATALAFPLLEVWFAWVLRESRRSQT